MVVLFADWHPTTANKMVILLRHILGSLWQRRLRSFLGMLGMACGVVIFLAPIAVEEGAKRKTLAQIGQLGLTNISIKASVLTQEQGRDARNLGSFGLMLSDAKRIKRWVPNVDEVAALREVSMTIYAETSGIAPQVLAVTPGFARLQGLKVAAGRFIVEEDVEQNSPVCVVGHQLAVSMGEKGRQGQMLRIGNGLCHIVGILGHFDKKAGENVAISSRDFDNVIFIPLENRAAGNLPISVTELIVKIRTADEVLPTLPAIRRVLSLMHNGVDDYQLVAPQQLLKQAEQARLTFDFVLWSISSIGFLIGGLGIMNIMLANVMERTREIGIRRALGAKRGDILMQFLVEALVLTLIGGLLGIALSLMGVWVVSGFADWEFVITPLVFFLSFLMPVLTGLFFGLYPAIRAANMNPITALRHE